ncbi:MAG TPA: YkgJ family cysteine cluster protein [Thermoanaerobaculia bacterium]
MPMIESLHEEVDRHAAALAARHAAKMACARGCSGCCVDDLTVFEVEAERIRRGAAAFLASAQPHSPGRCAFLGSEGECRIYALRPYVCRTQGLPLRWLDEEAEVEYRDICELNEVAVETLDPEECWTLGEVEERLARMQGDGRRVALRTLFQR